MKKLTSALLILSVLNTNTPVFAQSFSVMAGVPGPSGPGGPGGGHGGPSGPGGGGGPHPTPTGTFVPVPPSPRPTTPPVPTPPAPTPPVPTPVPVNTDQANRDGIGDGTGDGAREGRERGTTDGQARGAQEGQKQGFDACFKEESERQYDIGYREGFRVGGDEGVRAGQQRGEADGSARGDQEGRADGLTRSDRDADRAASPLGAAKGYEQANASDATDRGYADGAVQGDREAMAEAVRVDYARGRQTYRAEREAEAVQYNDEFSQRGGALASSSLSSSIKSLLGKSESFNTLAGPGNGPGNGGRGNGGSNNVIPSVNAANPGPDYRYSNPRRTYGTPQENTAYTTSYRSGYATGFSNDYGSTYSFNYQQAFNQSKDRGCREAQQRDYREFRSRGVNAGREKGYQEAYQRTYNESYRNTYNYVFPRSSEAAYNSAYQGDYNRHFEAARVAAYQSRVGELYNAAFARGRTEKYNQVYPGYAQQQYNLGRNDEAADFASRPVRLLGAEPTETIENGLFEPGEALRVRVSLRNFAGGSVAGRDVKLMVEAIDANSAIITQGEASLVKDLRSKSVTSVKEALEFRMSESAANRTSRLRVSAYYQGKNVGETVINVMTKFQVAVVPAEEFGLKDGIATQLKVKLTNQSQRATDATLAVSFLANSDKLDIQNPNQTIPALNPGESRVIEFTVVAHTSDSYVRVPMAFSVKGSSGRRVGLLDMTNEVPVINDYRITLDQSIASLQHAGITRAYYRVVNTGSRLLMKGLQLKVRIKAEDANNFVVLGPNPQYLTPLEKGESAQFLVPILVKEENSGGTVELELLEDGRTVVIHKADFTKGLN